MRKTNAPAGNAMAKGCAMKTLPVNAISAPVDITPATLVVAMARNRATAATKPASLR